MITNTGNVNSLINSYLTTNKNDINPNKFVNQIKYSEDSYVPSTKFATSLGVYSKEAEKNESVKNESISQEDYDQYCVLAYFFDAKGLCEPLYYPPHNAPYEVKKAWIETMKSLPVDEQRKVQISIISSIKATLRKYEPVTTEMYQNYLNNNFASYEGLVDLFLENFINSKEKECDKFMESVLNTFKMNYEKYSEK